MNWPRAYSMIALVACAPLGYTNHKWALQPKAPTRKAEAQIDVQTLTYVAIRGYMCDCVCSMEISKQQVVDDIDLNLL
jgi:hypothetical protein